MPLKVQKSMGSISFISEKLGEIWYELKLEGIDTGVERLPAI